MGRWHDNLPSWECQKCCGPKAFTDKLCWICAHPESRNGGGVPVGEWPKRQPAVYAVGARDYPSAPIKFGYATRPRQRLRELQVGSPVRLCFLAVARGGKEVEGAIHEYLEGANTHGEWFARCERTEYVLQFLKADAAADFMEVLRCKQELRRRINGLSLTKPK